MSFFWERIAKPVMFRLDAETAHEIGMKVLLSGLAPGLSTAATIPSSRFGLEFSNPLGIAAGFDKNAGAVNQLAALGFGFVEVGTVTLRPQPGNPKPRMFRLPKDRALINRLGFNNEGAEAVVKRLADLERKCVVGVNIGKNKDVPNKEATENYLATFEIVYPVADYVVVNISSPNTPNLRELQKSESLEVLLSALQNKSRELSGRNASVNERAGDSPKSSVPESQADSLTRLETLGLGTRDSSGTLLNSRVSVRSKPLLVKIAPDLTEAEIEAVVDICLKYEIAGIIATNTTISREGLLTANVDQFGAGGLSGKPLTKRSTEVISTIYKYSSGKLPIVGVGGIFTADDAFEKIAAGASLLQAYTGFVYGGPSFASEINEGLARILSERGFSTLEEAVGAEARA